MRLDDFVAESIKQIISGVKEAQSFGRANDSLVVPRDAKHAINNSTDSKMIMRGAASQPVFMIDFDVSVTASEHTKTGSDDVSVGDISVSSASSNEASASSVSRIKFHIPVVFPTTIK